MRWIRHGALAAALVVSLAVLGWVAMRDLSGIARLRAQALRDAIALEIDACAEHASYLARLSPDEIEGYLTQFRRLARVRIHDAEGRCTAHLERYGDLVARLPEARLRGGPVLVAPERGVARSGFVVDRERLDVDPGLREVVEFAAPRAGGGSLVLTAYAAPFLAPWREADARLVEPEDPERWSVAVPVARHGLALFLAVGLGILLLGVAALLLSERQIRAQERALLERRMAQQDRLSALGILAAGIAHEINNPLEGIANWLRLGNVEKAQEGFDRIRAIARDLLAFARPDAEGERADLRACLARALDLARYAPAFRGVEERIEAEEGLWAAAAPRMLDQVFLNLLLNAGAAMRDAPSRVVEVAARREGARIVARVRDHGTGIDPKDLPRLFDPFFSRSGGTGLGLSVSYGIMKAAGGALLAANHPGGGAVFTVEVPAA